MARVGVIGLGNIGGAIAANLVADGHVVTVHDTDAGRCAAATAAGAQAAADAAAVARASEVTFTSLPAVANDDLPLWPGLIMYSRYNSLKKIGNLDGPCPQRTS